MLKKELILEGLDCANCAAKIEQEVNELNGVKAYMNFMIILTEIKKQTVWAAVKRLQPQTVFVLNN